MGGKAAKERRRLRRLGLDASNDGLDKSDCDKNTSSGTTAGTHKPPSSPEKQSTGTSASVKVRNSNSIPMVNRNKTSERKWVKGDDGPPHHSGEKRRKPATGAHSNHAISPRKKRAGRSYETLPTATDKKKTKIVKPKHLKRKLEQANDNGRRQEILNEMKKWEHQKQKFRQLKSDDLESSKRQKTPKTLVSQDTGVNVANVRNASPRPSTHEKPTKPIVETTYPVNPEASTELVESNSFVNPKEAIVNNDPSDSESDVSLASETMKRQRGERRRGRKAVAAAAAKGSQDTSSIHSSDIISRIEQSAETVQAAGVAPVQQDVGTLEKEPESQDVTAKKTKKDNNDTRRCIGRKPVTDFVIGERYDGTVVYMKPFGVFIDIGCHSDAFCHVSRIQDDYVESPQSVLKVGNKVHARIVEMDRAQKRLTVSLQSDARVQDEKLSMEAKRQRSEKKKLKKQHEQQQQQQIRSTISQNTESPSKESLFSTDSSTPVHADANDYKSSGVSEMPIDESQMTPAELKRARKLARRAERRAQKELTGISA